MVPGAYTEKKSFRKDLQGLKALPSLAERYGLLDFIQCNYDSSPHKVLVKIGGRPGLALKRLQVSQWVSSGWK